MHFEFFMLVLFHFIFVEYCEMLNIKESLQPIKKMKAPTTCITLKCICLLFPEIKICQPPKSNSIKELSVAKSTCPGKQCPGGCCNVDWWYCCKGGRYCASHPGLCHKKTPSESKIY